MKNRFIAIISIFLTLSPAFGQEKPKDGLQQIMDRLGITENNLGWQPKSYWMRYPDPKQIPFKLNIFDDLFAQPQYIYDYLSTMTVAVEDFLHPEYLKTAHDGIMKTGFYCGVMPYNSQFRAYSASLWAEVSKEQPLLNAIKNIYLTSHNTFTYNRMGEKGEFPLNEKDLSIQLKKIDPKLQPVIAAAIINLTEAWRFVQIGMRNVDYQDAAKCWRIRHLGETQFDGMEYYPYIEDAAKDIDMASILYAGIKLMAISQELSDTIIKLKASKLPVNWKEQYLDWQTPIGRIVITGSKDDDHRYNDAFFVLDLGGDDHWYGPAGATPSLSVPVALVIDIEGDDVYENDDEYTPAHGSAIFGAAMLLDVSGNDTYQSKRLSQGAAMLGIGILCDLNGNDNYQMWTDGQGAAYLGVGLAIDNKGNDRYKIWGDGQGYGGIGGVGTLINRTGDDYYFAEKDTAVVFRSDYWHSEKGQYNYSYVQGCGIGRRGDVTDGHSWAGGMGTLIDLSGNDKYEAGGWSQGCGYWYGIGLLCDKSGNDEYYSTHWAQAAGAHFAIGCLFDEGGNDKHVNWGKLAAGIAFAHDYVIAILYEKGGNDYYKVHDDGLGYAINMSQTFFIDTEGDDTYISGKGHHYGWNNYESQNPPGVTSVYHLYSDQICIFADFQGIDNYFTEDFESGKQQKDTVLTNNSEKFFPDSKEKEKLASKRYFGIGKDFEGYDGGEVNIFRRKIKPRYKDFE